MSDIYAAGQMDSFIRTALDRAAIVRDIYRRVANVRHPEHWLPLGAICPSCGKVGTTIASDWDGETVAVLCREDLVAWARGCGWTGRIAPFGGAAKLPWNLEWAAQWSLFGVTIEPCGKDLSTAGGSRDRSDAIAREVFEREPPLNVPYEFLNLGGRKMSTSKGVGAAAHTMAAVLPPEQIRFLFVRHRPNEAIEFDPVGTDAIPRLFDEFDRLAAAAAGRKVKGELPSGHEAIFRYSLLEPAADVGLEAEAYRPPFAHLALLAQVPGADVRARMEAEKGSELSPREVVILDDRLRAVRAWLDGYAPDRAVVAVRDEIPPGAAALESAERAYLGALAVAAPAPGASGEAWQAAIFSTAAARGLEPGRAFAALYRAFLGRPNGPRAGWLLASLDRPFVLARLRQAAESGSR
jgi:lysyl-tRNA synthetase class 1